MCSETNRTHLFVIRLWQEEAPTPAAGWRGSITFTTSGETRYFRDAATLYAALQRLLAADPPDADLPTA